MAVGRERIEREGERKRAFWSIVSIQNGYGMVQKDCQRWSPPLDFSSFIAKAKNNYMHNQRINCVLLAKANQLLMGNYSYFVF